jgi:hypothetical protein
MSCEHCPEHSGHDALIRDHKDRLHGHDVEFKDIKDAMKLKLPRWVFISVMTVLVAVLGYQTTTLISIDKKVAVLYDREEMRNKINKVETTYLAKDVETNHDG